jgi:hypothetical protein
MAGQALPEDESKRVVCLKRENSTDMQLFKIEPVTKKMRVENPTTEVND